MNELYSRIAALLQDADIEGSYYLVRYNYPDGRKTIWVSMDTDAVGSTQPSEKHSFYFYNFDPDIHEKTFKALEERIKLWKSN